MELDDDLDLDFERAARPQPAAAAPVARNFRAIHKRVVCRYWLTNSCVKGDACEFLHDFVEDKMPECRKGPSCADPSCVLRHDTKREVPVCPNYEAGFCSFGHSCKWRHEFRDAPPPPVAAQWLLDDPAKAVIAARARAEARTFRKAPCPYWAHDGWCPYFYACAFKH